MSVQGVDGGGGGHWKIGHVNVRLKKSSGRVFCMLNCRSHPVGVEAGKMIDGAQTLPQLSIIIC